MDETAKRKPTVWDEMRMRIRTLTGQIETTRAEIDHYVKLTRELEEKAKDLEDLRYQYRRILP